MSERMTPSNWNDKPERQNLTTERIEDLLPRYEEAHGNAGGRYSVLQSRDINGHEVAWMQYAGTVVTDMSGHGREGKSFVVHDVKCACDFTEGVGWKVSEMYGATGIADGLECSAFNQFMEDRRMELRAAYGEQFAGGSETDLGEYVEDVLFDLIEKEKAGEFIGERPGGARFWGGHLYGGLVKEITGCSWETLHSELGRLVREKKIQLNGMVVQEYYEPPVPAWEEYARIARDGWTVVVRLPVHGHMEQTVQFALLEQSGRIVAENMPGPHLVHSSDFGVDIEDVAVIEQAANELIDSALQDPMSFA